MQKITAESENAACAEMASDEEREVEALVWSETVIGDVSDTGPAPSASGGDPLALRDPRPQTGGSTEPTDARRPAGLP